MEKGELTIIIATPEIAAASDGHFSDWRSSLVCAQGAGFPCQAPDRWSPRLPLRVLDFRRPPFPLAIQLSLFRVHGKTRPALREGSTLTPLDVRPTEAQWFAILISMSADGSKRCLVEQTVRLPEVIHTEAAGRACWRHELRVPDKVSAVFRLHVIA